MENEQIIDLQFKDIFKVVKKRFYIVIILTCISMLLSAVYNYYFIKPVYVGKASIIIGNQNEDKDRGIDNNSLMLYQNLLKTYSSIAQTTNVAEETIDRLGLNMTPDALKSRISATPRADTQILDLSVIAQDSQQAYDLINTLTNVFIKQAKLLYPVGNVQLMDKIEMPAYPIDNNNRNIFLAFCIGIVFSLVIIGLIEYMDNTIKVEKEVELYLGLPVIGLIPKENKKINNIGKNSISKLDNRLVEAFRILRTNIDFISVNKNVKAITVTGCTPGEGRTTTAALLAIVMAQAGKKTILVDCDFRQSKIHNLFNLTNMEGVSNILIGASKLDDTIKKSIIENLDVLTSGTKPPNPAELISTQNMLELMNQLKKDYDYVILDTPAVGLVTDAQILSQISDGCLMVLSSGKAEQKAAIKAKELLQYVDAKILGTSLNMVNESFGSSSNNRINIFNTFNNGRSKEIPMR